MLGDPTPYRPAPLVLVRPVRRQAADRRPQRRLGHHHHPPRPPPRQPVGLVLAGRPPPRRRRHERPARLHDRQALDRGRRLARPRGRRRPGHRPQGARLMRIIGGTHRGLTLADLGAGDPARTSAPPPTGSARASSTSSPTATTATRRRRRARRVLDLFAGTGALGLEALSRGAVHATFVDQGQAALALLRRNLGRMGVEETARVVTRDATRLGRNPGAALRPRLPRPALRPRPRREGGRLGARRRLGGARRRSSSGRRALTRPAARLDPPRPAPLWGHDDRDLPLDRPPSARPMTDDPPPARPGLGLPRLPPRPGGDRHRRRGRPRRARHHADRRRQVALLPAPGPHPPRRHPRRSRR